MKSLQGPLWGPGGGVEGWLVAAPPLLPTSPPHLCLLHSWSHTPGPQRTGSFQAASFHVEATGFASVFPWQGLLHASCSKRPRLQASLSWARAFGVHIQGKEGEQNKLIKRRGKERGLGTGEICTFSHLQDTRPILWPAYPNQNLGCPGARSQRRLRPCLLQASQPRKEVEKLTSSLSCQGLMLPGRWSSQCPTLSNWPSSSLR